MKYMFVFFLLVACRSFAAGQPELSEEPPAESMLLALMADAEEEDYEYSVKTSMVSDYRVSSYRAFVYFENEHTLTQIQDDFVPTRARLVDFKFKAPFLEQAYLVLEIKYGPNFLYDTNATGICVAPFDGTNIFDQIPCNTLVTAQYLIAAAMHNSPIDNVINADATRQFLKLNHLPNRKYWQDYLAVHQMVLAHLAEIEDYQMAHQGQYLEVGYQIVQALLTDVRRIRRLRVQDIDDAVISIDKTMVNFAYRLYMSMEGLFKRNIYLLPKVQESPGFIRDFFEGRIVFSLLTEEAAVVSGLTQKGDLIQFTYWPWFESLRLVFDGHEPIFTTDTEFKIPSGANRVDVTGFGSNGRYATLRYTILPFDGDITLSPEEAVKQSLDMPANQVSSGTDISTNELTESVQTVGESPSEGFVEVPPDVK